MNWRKQKNTVLEANIVFQMKVNITLPHTSISIFHNQKQYNPVSSQFSNINQNTTPNTHLEKSQVEITRNILKKNTGEGGLKLSDAKSLQCVEQFGINADQQENDPKSDFII